MPRSCPRRSSALPAARYSSESGCGGLSSGAGPPLRRSAPTMMWPSSGAAPVCAAVDAAVDDDPAADPGADRDHHERLRDQVEVVVVGLGQRGDGGVVVDEHRHVQALAQQLAQRHAAQRDVHRRAGGAGLEVDDRRDPEADGLRVARGLDHLDELVHQRVGARQLGLLEARLGEDAVLEDGDRDFCTADVDADQPFSHCDSPYPRTPATPRARKWGVMLSPRRPPARPPCPPPGRAGPSPRRRSSASRRRRTGSAAPRRRR